MNKTEWVNPSYCVTERGNRKLYVFASVQEKAETFRFSLSTYNVKREIICSSQFWTISGKCFGYGTGFVKQEYIQFHEILRLVIKQ